MRAGSGHRRYPRAVLRRIAFILFAQKVGLCLEETGAELLVAAADERVDDTEAQLVAALAASVAGWDARAEESFARAAHAPEPPDPALYAEIDAALAAGSAGVRRLLLEELAPSVLRERLSQPI